MGFLALKELRIHGLTNTGSMIFHQKLFSSKCPVLEVLSFSDCGSKNQSPSAMIISAPMLKKLEFLNSTFDPVVISSPLLAFFKYEGCKPIDLCIDDNCCLLEEVDVDIIESSSYSTNAGKLPDMFSELKSAKSVTVSLNTLKALSEAYDGFLSEQPSVFQNLRNLKVKVDWSVPEIGLYFLLKNEASNHVETSFQVPSSLRSRLKNSKII